MEYKKSEYVNALPNYLENSYLQIKPFYHTDLKYSLEKTVLMEEPERETGLLERVFSDKSKNLKATIKALFNEILLREKLNSHLLNKVDDDICSQHTYMANLKNLSVHYSPDLSREMNNTKMQIEGKVLDLEKEKRKEYLECWRDLMFLKRYLFMALKDYWDLSKKRNVLGYDLNNLAENDKGKGY
jgi:hypothetical protein